MRFYKVMAITNQAESEDDFSAQVFESQVYTDPVLAEEEVRNDLANAKFIGSPALFYYKGRKSRELVEVEYVDFI